MARTPPPLKPSVLDRLLNDDMAVDVGTHFHRSRVLSEIKESLRRDLRNLLNTRARNLTWDPNRLKMLSKSLADYGLPDFTATSLGSDADSAKFCTLIQEIIERHEPRLKEVKVVPAGEGETMDRTFSFRIEARLDVDQAPEPVVFDSQLKPATNTFEVKEQA
jgi:type VI secretion system protein ImpF